MKLNYTKPVIEFEEYELNTAIASACGTKVSLGPGSDTQKTVCDEYIQVEDVTTSSRDPQTYNFYDEVTCTCYLSSQGETIFTS